MFWCMDFLCCSTRTMLSLPATVSVLNRPRRTKPADWGLFWQIWSLRETKKHVLLFIIILCLEIDMVHIREPIVFSCWFQLKWEIPPFEQHLTEKEHIRGKKQEHFALHQDLMSREEEGWMIYRWSLRWETCSSGPPGGAMGHSNSSSSMFCSLSLTSSSADHLCWPSLLTSSFV